MTSPRIISLNLEEDIILPNNPNKFLRINTVEDTSEFESWCEKGKRTISLFDSVKGHLINYDTEEILIFHEISHIGNYDDNSIVESFHSDDVEYI